MCLLVFEKQGVKDRRECAVRLCERAGLCVEVGSSGLGRWEQEDSRSESVEGKQAEPPPLPGQPEQPHHAVLAIARPAGADPAVDAPSSPAVPTARPAQLAAQLQRQVGLAGVPLPAWLTGKALPGAHSSQTCSLSICCSSGPAPSPSSFLPSPSPQPSQSPVTARTPQNFSVPSPGPLNTPGKLGLGWAQPKAQNLSCHPHTALRVEVLRVTPSPS